MIIPVIQDWRDLMELLLNMKKQKLKPNIDPTITQIMQCFGASWYPAEALEAAKQLIQVQATPLSPGAHYKDISEVVPMKWPPVQLDDDYGLTAKMEQVDDDYGLTAKMEQQEGYALPIPAAHPPREKQCCMVWGNFHDSPWDQYWPHQLSFSGW